jgi:hypothetical protein
MLKKKDLDILNNSIENFKKNFNLIEQYELNGMKKKVKKIVLFKVLSNNIVSTIKLYLLLIKKDTEKIK